jgi:hypothetical protein
VATIIHLGNSNPSSDAGRDDPTLSWLVGSLLLALAVVLREPVVGLAVAGLFVTGVLLARVERRPLRPVEFVAIATLHAAAVVLLAL